MKLALSLAAALSLSLPASASDCAVRMRAHRQNADLPFDAASSECRLAVSLVPDFAKLRATAGFSSGSLLFRVDPDTVEVNASYLAGVVAPTAAYFREGLNRESMLVTLAHEIGHAVQDRDGLIAWLNQPIFTFYRRVAGRSPSPTFFGSVESAEYQEYMIRSRKLEAQADAIGQELLFRAGYDEGVFARGRARRFGCEAPESISDRNTTSHPLDSHRYINAALASSAISSAKSGSLARAASSALGEMRSQTDGVPAAASAGAARPMIPTVKVRDYDDLGRIKPGRLVASRLAVPPPPQDAGVVRDTAQRAIASAVDYWVVEPFQAAVDQISEPGRRAIARKILASCSTVQDAETAGDYGVLGWMGRVAADAARRAARAISPGRR